LSCHIDAYLPCPIVSVPASWEAFLLRLSKKDRHELRRKLRRALADGDWTWRASQTREELRDDLQTFFRLHRSSRTDKAAFLTPTVEAFFRDIVHALFEQSQVRLGIFARSGQPLAATLSFVYHGRYMLYNSGHDPAARALSPGIVATALAIQDAITLRCEVFDFLSGPERYKYHFGAHDEWTYRIVVERAAA
jgi:CelD/BcsL family acetyltransferase involved in cellulose biosynthesis